MKRLYFAVIACLLGIVFASGPAMAADSVDEATAALQTSSVYVAKSTEGTTNNTPVTIKAALTPKDHIVVVLMGKGTELDNDRIANKILGSLKEPSILALYANGQFGGYTNRQYVPADTLNRVVSDASNIAVGPVETTTMFIKLVHDYQAAHPEPVASAKPAAGQSGGSSSAPFWIGGLAFLIALFVITVKLTKHDRTDVKPATPEVATFRQIADGLQEDIEGIDNSLDKQNMLEMLRILRDVVEKTEEQNPDILADTASNLASQLNTMHAIVTSYLDNQEYPSLPGARERAQGYGNAFQNFRIFAEKRMEDLLRADFNGLQFEINRWRPQEDEQLPSSLDLN